MHKLHISKNVFDFCIKMKISVHLVDTHICHRNNCLCCSEIKEKNTKLIITSTSVLNLKGSAVLRGCGPWVYSNAPHDVGRRDTERKGWK